MKLTETDMFKELYKYREMIVSMVRRDLRSRYKGSILGFAWTFINPLLQLIVYYFVFKILMKAGIPKFHLYLFVGLIPWIFFSTCLVGGSVSIIVQKDLIKKIYFPREVIPISYVIGAFVNMALSFIVVIAVALVSGVVPSVGGLLCLPVIMIVEFIFALGLALIASALTVYLRDLEHILGIITMAWQFATPICYGEFLIPERFKAIYSLNPMTPIIRAYRAILYEGGVPDLSTLIESLVIGLFFLVVGAIVFRKLQVRFAEEL